MKLSMYLAFAFLWTLILVGKSPAYVTQDDVLSGRYAEEYQSQTTVTIQGNSGNYGSDIPQPPAVNTEVVCSPDFTKCTARAVEPQPVRAGDCPAGETLVKIRRYGVLSRVCVPE